MAQRPNALELEKEMIEGPLCAVPSRSTVATFPNTYVFLHYGGRLR